MLTGVLNSTGGQNPTVKIRWGDEDRGTAVTPSTAWDNEVTVSTNQAAGTFSTTITIPNLEKVYYFRAIASNSGGTVVSRSLGVLLPSAPVGVANLQGRWDFDGSNANDSSGKGHHGTAKKLFAPSELTNVSLWLDASDSSTITHNSNSISQWSDKSGNGNHAIQSTSTKQPTLVANKVVFDGTDDHIISSGLNVSQSYSFFIAGKTNNNSSGRDYLFDGVGSTQSHRSLIALDNGGKIQMWASSWANTNVNTPTSDFVLSAVFNTSSSSLALNGTSVTGLSVGSYNLTNGITIGANHVANNDFLDGNIAEFIILDETSSAEKQRKVEGYLAHKWGLVGSLPSSHPYSLGHPIASSGTPSYITDTPFGSGKAIDLADGHVEVSTGESEDEFDGGASFSVSAWVKGWPTESYAPFVSKGATFPKPSDVASLKLWLDAADTSVMDQGSSLGASGPPANGNNVKFWGDKSGNGYHGISDQTPTYNTTGINNNYPGINTNGDAYLVENSAADFDAWDSMTLFFVTKWGAPVTGLGVLKKDKTTMGHQAGRSKG